MLFALFIYYVKNVIKTSKFLLFCDNLKFFVKVNSIIDCKHLNDDLNEIVLWASITGMSLNIQKCHYKTFYRFHCPIVFDYKIVGSKLERAKQTIRDLGVIFDTKLTFYSYIEFLSCKTLKILDFVKRICAQYKLVAPIKALYYTLVRSVLEYNSVLWDICVLSEDFCLLLVTY
jgi:hypothetical protein